MKLKKYLVMITMLSFTLTACGKNAETTIDFDSANQENSSAQETEDSTSADEQEEKDTAADGADMTEIPGYLPAAGRSVLMNGDTAYALVDGHLVVTDLQTRKSRQLFEGKDMSYYDSGLICMEDGMLYFMAAEDAGDTKFMDNQSVDTTKNLYGMNLQTEEVTMLVSAISDSGQSLDVYNHTLYLSDYSGIRAYAIQEDGSVVESTDKDFLRQMLPAGYNNIYAARGNDYAYQSPAFCARFLDQIYVMGTPLSSTDPEDYRQVLIAVNKENGEAEEVSLPEDASVLAITRDYILYQVYSQDYSGWEVYAMNPATQSSQKIGNDLNIVDYNENGLLCVESAATDTGTKFTYSFINWKGEEKQELFTLDSVPGMTNIYLNGASNISLYGDLLYYTYGKNGKTNLYLRDITKPGEAVLLYEGIYDNGMGAVGTVQAEHSTIYATNYPDKVAADIYVEWLELKGDSPAIQKINATLKQSAESSISYGTSLGESTDEWFSEDYAIASSYEVKAAGITYQSDRYLSIEMDSYDYEGGAHGMPGRDYWLFDLQTGDQLTLSDVCNNSQEEIKALLETHFADYVQEHGEELFPEAMDTVKADTSFMDRFYLNDQGIVIYFYPYDVGPYAAGFIEVTIPYEELNMKII